MDASIFPYTVALESFIVLVKNPALMATLFLKNLAKLAY